MTLMKRLLSLAVYVIALLALQQTSMAQNPPAPGLPDVAASGVISSPQSLAKFASKRTGGAAMPAEAFNGFAQFRSTPDLGAPGSGGIGFHHFSLPMDRYTNWYRPRAATLTQYQRCAPDSFRPRGFGHLFARPCDGYRMEYEPYMLSDGKSKYGPAYLSRMPDPRCPHCDHTADDCEDCDSCRLFHH